MKRFFHSAVSFALLASTCPAAETSPKAPVLGPAQPFTFELLVERAKRMAAAPCADGAEPRAAEILEQIDYDAFGKITFRPERTLRVGKSGVRLFHLQRYAKKPVGIHLVEDGASREVLFSPEFFDLPADSPARDLPADIGFAGFRVLEFGKEADWMAFMGAAYFRTSGEMNQFGLSARALAVGTAMPAPEEFPRFTHFFFAPSEKGELVVHALMDSPSVTGAVRFDVSRPAGVVMMINARFFARREMPRMGLAPLTSMFWFSEYSRRKATDWRPEIHDSDGLAIWTGTGERLWRPLNNPPRVMTSSFLDRNVRGFGLSQRDRAFDHYQDDGVFYERRSTCWVEPVGDWGPGMVQLVEIPTDDEIYDNIVAYWLGEKPVAPGQEVRLDYQLHWVKDEPYPAVTGRVFSSRTGAGGVPGQPRPPGVVKFVIDFEGGQLGTLGREDGVEAEVSASSGKISGVYALPVVGTKRWRAVFDLAPAALDPVELRLFLRRKGVALTETWLSQYHPEKSAAAGKK
jgi:glucans biosynthesis protein